MENPESIPIKYRESRMTEEQRRQNFLQCWEAMSASRQDNLRLRASLFGMSELDFFYSPYYQPLERQPYSRDRALTKEEYYRREAERDKAEDDRRYEYAKKAAKLRKKRARKRAEGEQRAAQRRNDRLLYDILSYAVAHGWRRDRLHLLLEEGEELPLMFRPENIIPLEAVNSVSS